jgi:quercetin dioxygenase-like cupin family protein
MGLAPRRVMSDHRPTMRPTQAIGVSLFVLTATVAAQVPVNKEPHHRTVYENADFRILDVRLDPGDSAAEHRHDHDIVTVSMNAGTPTRITVAGQTQNRPPRPLANATIAEYTGKPASHKVDNIGGAPYQLFAVENLRDAKAWSPSPALAALATTLATDGRALRIYDVRLATPTSQTTHTHAVPTVAVLINGIVMSEGPDAQAKALAPAPVGLKRLDSPGQWVLIPRGETHTVVRLGNVDARLLEIEVR